MSPAGFGAVLVHGKWDTAPFAHAPLARALSERGIPVACPEMPWSLQQRYAATFASGVGRIREAVAQLKAQSAGQVLLCGHSLGATAVLAALPHPDVAGVVLMAPGHFPTELYATGLTRKAVNEARQMQSQKDSGKSPYTDVSEGRSRRIRMPADVYLSYYGPHGPACPHAHASALHNTPLLWIEGTQDQHDAAARGKLLQSIAALHAAEQHQVDADHRNTPAAALPRVLQWIQGLSTFHQESA